MLKSPFAFVFLFFVLAANVLADPPPRPFETFDAAKKVARDGIYAGHHVDFLLSLRFHSECQRFRWKDRRVIVRLQAQEEQGKG